MQAATKQQDTHDLLVSIAKELQNLGAQVQVPSIATSTPSTLKAAKGRERRHVPKTINYTIYCDREILDSNAKVLICLMMLCLCLIIFILPHCML